MLAFRLLKRRRRVYSPAVGTRVWYFGRVTIRAAYHVD